MLTRVSTIVCRQALLKASTMSQRKITCRHIHLVTQIRKIPKSSCLLNLHINHRVTGIPLIRYASTNQTPLQNNPYDEIPDPPTPIQDILETIAKVHPNGESTFESIGLGGYTPVGLIQNFMEFVHIDCGMPWWTTIVIGTLCVRTIIFPMVIMAQKNMIKFSNHMPIIQQLQMKMTEARQSGDHIESAQAAQELMEYMKKNNISAMKNFIVPLIQAPVFISFFLALKGMANLPVESLKVGGFWWLKDLTIHDPYYIMPIFTVVTMYVTIELGSDGTNIKMMGMMRYVLRALPFVLLPFMLHFPGTVLTYWASTNFISLAQTGLLKIPYIKKALKMPTVVPQITPASNSKKTGNFIEEIKEGWTNMKISKQLADRERADALQFNSAGKGPIIKTFKYDPTKRKQSTILTKNK